MIVRNTSYSKKRFQAEKYSTRASAQKKAVAARKKVVAGKLNKY
jgi:hypothetical protein